MVPALYQYLLIFALFATQAFPNSQFNVQKDTSLTSLFSDKITFSGSQVLRVFWKDLVKFKKLNYFFEAQTIDVWVANPRERYL
jgi:hypothetical protein